MRTTTLAATIFLAAFATGYDADTKDATGCPTVFQGKCHCKKQTYHRWKPDVETFVVNCTNTRFNSKLGQRTGPRLHCICFLRPSGTLTTKMSF